LVKEFGAQPTAELIQSFLASTAPRLEELAQFTAAGNQELLASSAHALAGSATIFGLEHLHRSALRLERSAKASAWNDCRLALEAVARGYEAGKTTLEDHLVKIAAPSSDRETAP
jgi:HPt (histidine-containing phosphotransfer) domain-containing protein